MRGSLLRLVAGKWYNESFLTRVSQYIALIILLNISHEASSTSLNEEAVYRAEADNQTATVAEELSGEDGVDEADKEIDAVEKKEKQCMDDLEEAIDMEKIVREAIACDNKLPDYEDILDAEGWRAQLPYDPFNVKYVFVHFLSVCRHNKHVLILQSC